MMNISVNSCFVLNGQNISDLLFIKRLFPLIKGSVKQKQRALASHCLSLCQRAALVDCPPHFFGHVPDVPLPAEIAAVYLHLPNSATAAFQLTQRNHALGLAGMSNLAFALPPPLRPFARHSRLTCAAAAKVPRSPPRLL